MEEIVKFTKNHQKQEVTVVEPADEMSEKLFKFLHKSDVRMISAVVGVLGCIVVVNAVSLPAFIYLSISAYACLSTYLYVRVHVRSRVCVDITLILAVLTCAPVYYNSQVPACLRYVFVRLYECTHTCLHLQNHRFIIILFDF